MEELKFYTDISEMPLKNYLKCLCDDDFTFLYKETPQVRDLVREQEIFTELSTQYAEAMEGKTLACENQKEIAVLISRIRILEAALGMVYNMPENIKELLKTIGIRLTNDVSKNILLIQGKISTFARKYKELYEKENGKEDKKPTMRSYTDTLIVMCSHFKFHIGINDITVGEFCGYYKRFSEEIESISRAAKKK